MEKRGRSEALKRKVFLERSPALTQAGSSVTRGRQILLSRSLRHALKLQRLCLVPCSAPQDGSQGPLPHVTPPQWRLHPGLWLWSHHVIWLQRPRVWLPGVTAQITSKTVGVSQLPPAWDMCWKPGSLHTPECRLVLEEVGGVVKRFRSPSEGPRGEKQGSLCHPAGRLRDLVERVATASVLPAVASPPLQCSRAPDFSCHYCWGPLTAFDFHPRASEY